MTVGVVGRPFAEPVRRIHRWLPGNHGAVGSIQKRPHRNVAHAASEQPVERARPSTAHHVAQHGDARLHLHLGVVAAEPEFGIDQLLQVRR